MNQTNNDLSRGNPSRIVALDYLRVIAVSILFVYHLCMIWVPDWGFHFKQETNWYWLQPIMMLSSPWRMGLLWFISGASIYIMQEKRGTQFILLNRSNAILLPLLFGLLFVVPIQLFVEMTQKGAIDSTFKEFVVQFYFGSNRYFEGFGAGVWHHIDVNHLWFLRSLWRFTLILMLVLMLLQFVMSTCRQTNVTFNLKWLVLLLAMSFLTMNIEDSDLKRDIYGFCCLLMGYLFGPSEQFWQWLKTHRRLIVLVAVGLTLIYEVGFWFMQQPIEGEALNNGAFINSAFIKNAVSNITRFSYYGAKIVSLVAILVIAHRVFIKPQPLISKLNSYVFPLYVLHQSVLIIVAFVVAGFEYAPMVSLLLTLVISAVICAAFLVVCKYNTLIGILLGKRPAKVAWANTKVAQGIISIVSLPLAMRLLGVI